MDEPFFLALPDDIDDDPQYHEPPRDPRREAPRDELGALIAVGEHIAATDRVAIILTSVAVHSDGVVFHFERHLRRHGLATSDWQRMQNDFGGYWGVTPSRERMRWGLVLGDGRKVIADYPLGDDREDGGVDKPFFLGHRGGGGGGSMDRQRHADELWLHPLPPAGPFEVVVQWPAFDIPESRTVLDGTAIVAQAARARRIWPDETARSGGTD